MNVIIMYTRKFKNTLRKEHLNYAGILGPKSADALLNIIYKSRKNKNIKSHEISE